MNINANYTCRFARKNNFHLADSTQQNALSYKRRIYFLKLFILLLLSFLGALTSSSAIIKLSAPKSPSTVIFHHGHHISFAKKIHSFSSLSYDRSKTSSKASSPLSAIYSFLLQVRVSSPFFKVI